MCSSEATLSSSRADRCLRASLAGGLGRHHRRHPHSLEDCGGCPGRRCRACPSTLGDYRRGFTCSPPPPCLCTSRHSRRRHLGARRWWNRWSVIIRRIRQNYLPPLGLGGTTNANWPLLTPRGPRHLPPLRGCSSSTGHFPRSFSRTYTDRSSSSMAPRCSDPSSSASELV